MSAQALTESKSTDNIYIGVNGGVATKTVGSNWLNNLNPNAGLRIGRYFTPVFGLALDGNAYFSNKPYQSSGTAVRFTNVSLLGTVNLSNWFGGYQGEPRPFEVSVVGGFGWGHLYSHNVYKKANHGTSKLGLDFGVNLGKDKAWQFYVEPSMTWCFLARTVNHVADTYQAGVNSYQPAYNINNSMFQLNAGFIYRFRNSNGEHYFTTAQIKDLSEIDALNARINSLRNEIAGRDADLASKDREIADLARQLRDCRNEKRPVVVQKQTTATNLLPTVIFKQGKSNVEPAQMAQIELIAIYMRNHPNARVEIKGYASPEGDPELNQRLSEARANSVRDVLVNRYGISSSRLSTVGCGPTSTLFEQVEFNRVATFNDNTK